MRYLISAKAVTPLAFRSGRDKGQEGTLSYVPGSALLGGLASAHTRLRPERHEEFAAFFLEGRAVFGNLYPSRFSKPNRRVNPLDDERSPIRPLPRTARSCKRFSGFRFHADVDADDRHGVWDSLIAWAAFALSGETDATVLNQLRDCAQPCGEPLDNFEGFYRRGSQPGHWGSAEARPGMFTRTGVSRSRGAAAEGLLYSRDFLHEGNEFYGEWRIDDDIAAAVQAFVEEVSDGTLRVGHNRTRGLGKLSFPQEFREVTPDSAIDIEARARRFDGALREAVGVDARHGFYLPLSLTSDCIWPDALGRYRLQITFDAFQEAFGIGDAKLVYCNAGARLVTGWSSLWGLPKADEWAMAMGSVFLFDLSEEPDWQALAAVQARGLGTRRAEGFGAFRIADEFHWEVNGV